MTILLQGAGLQTAAAAPVPPLFISAEVGTVNASTVAVTFDQDVSAAGSDYSSGVTIKVNGSTRAFESGIRQANHAIVYYALSLAVVFGDVVTWEYVEASGNIVAEDDSTPLEDVSAQSVTNNVAFIPSLLLDLQADQLALSDGDPVSLWTDGVNSFTQTGTARPTKQTISAYPVVVFDSTDDSLIGSDILADNLNAFTVFIVRNVNPGSLVNAPVLSKISSLASGAGWMIYQDGYNILTQEDGGSVYYEQDYSALGHDGKRVFTYVFNSKNSFDFYIDGVLQTPVNTFNSGTVVDMSTTEPVRINSDGRSGDGRSAGDNYVSRIYAGVFDSSGRAAIESELAARYGITL